MRKTENMGDPKIREALDCIEMPQDSEKRVLERVNAASRGEHMETVLRKKPFPVRRVVLIAAAVLLLAAVSAGLFIALRPTAPEPSPEPETGSSGEKSNGSDASKGHAREGSDWVAELFEDSGSPENGEGVVTGKPGEGENPFSESYAAEMSAEPAPTEVEPTPGTSYVKDGGRTKEEKPAGLEPYEGWDEPDVLREEPEYWDDVDGTPNGQLKAGTLTAGSIDDNRYFKEFLEKADEMKAFAPLWRMYPTRRMTVRVKGVNNAMVAMSDQQGNVISYARTDANGCAYLYYDLYSETSSSRPAKIGVSNGSAFTEVVLTGSEGDVIEVECGEPAAQEKLDVLVMLDTTGSMGDEISYLQTELEDVIGRVKKEAGNAKIRLSVNFYRDHGDDYVVSYNPFTENIQECVKLLNRERADGGGDFPEAVDEALLNATADHAWDPDAVKVMFLILDAPPHDESDRQGTVANLQKAVDSARKQGIRIIPIVASGIDDSTEYLMRSVAAATGGTYVFLTNHSGVGGDHKDPNVDQYSVEKLNDLMVRLILSYWGVEVPDPVSGGNETSGETETSGGSVSDETFYRITIEGPEASNVKSAPSSAAAGETVELRTNLVTEGTTIVTVDGERLEMMPYDWDCCVFTFVMPDHDVTVVVSFQSVEGPPPAPGFED